MGYDDVMLHVGKINWYQRRIILILCLPAMSCALHKLGGVFLSAKPEFRCLLVGESQGDAIYHLPPGFTNVTKDWPTCEKFSPSFDESNKTAYGNNSSKFTSAKCDSFVYDKTYYTETVTTEWNLICDNAWIKTFAETLFMLSDVPGAMIWGSLSDRYGRKTALLWGSLMQLVCGLIVAISPNLITYISFRVLVGSTASGLISIAFVSALEMVSPSYRPSTGATLNIAFTLGHLLSGGLAYLIRKWRSLQIALTVPMFILLAFWWSIPESVRWLLTKGRVQEARDILEKSCSKIGTELPRSTLDGLLDNVEKSGLDIEQGSLFDLMRYPNLRKKSLVLFFTWLVLGGTFYGIALNTSSIGGDPYLNFVISATIGIPAHILPILTLNKWGRKKVVSGSLLLSGIPLLLTFFVPMGMIWPMRLLVMTGKLAICCALGAVYVFTSELYPTTVRNVGFASCAAFSKIGGAAGPTINHLFQISTSLPFVILGSSAITAGLLSLLLPETLNKKLPETIEDDERCERKASGTDRDIE